MASNNSTYYIPHRATWPVMATFGLMVLLAGFANYLNGATFGPIMMAIGFGVFIFMLAGWFALQSSESEAGMYNHQVDISYRMGMMWFIFSEVMFFAVFFGALWYTRNLSVHWLGGEGVREATKALLWPDFQAA